MDGFKAYIEECNKIKFLSRVNIDFPRSSTPHFVQDNDTRDFEFENAYRITTLAEIELIEGINARNIELFICVHGYIYKVLDAISKNKYVRNLSIFNMTLHPYVNLSRLRNIKKLERLILGGYFNMTSISSLRITTRICFFNMFSRGQDETYFQLAKLSKKEFQQSFYGKTVEFSKEHFNKYLQHINFGILFDDAHYYYRYHVTKMPLEKINSIKYVKHPKLFGIECKGLTQWNDIKQGKFNGDIYDDINKFCISKYLSRNKGKNRR
jgi:hypothetical protein